MICYHLQIVLVLFSSTMFKENKLIHKVHLIKETSQFSLLMLVHVQFNFHYVESIVEKFIVSRDALKRNETDIEKFIRLYFHCIKCYNLVLTNLLSFASSKIHCHHCNRDFLPKKKTRLYRGDEINRQIQYMFYKNKNNTKN